MFTSNRISSSTRQNSDSSVKSNESEAMLGNTVQYGPITVRQCRRAAPTLENGRRSKDLVLVGDEAARREKRRERNRDAAKKLKEKRQTIEEELNQQVKDLEDHNSDLQNYLQDLSQKKELLQNEVNSVQSDPLDELLANKNCNMTLFFEEYSDHSESFDESIERILNFD